MWQAAWAFSGIWASGERKAPAKLIFFHKNVWASLEKCPKCIETWRQMVSNSKVEATVLFLKYRAEKFGLLSSEVSYVVVSVIGKNVFAAINKSCIIKICKNKTEQRHFLLSTCCSELRLDSSSLLFWESNSLKQICCGAFKVCRPLHRVFFVWFCFFKTLVNVTHLYKSMHVLQTCDSVIIPGLLPTKRSEWDKDTFRKVFWGSLVRSEHGKQG